MEAKVDEHIGSNEFRSYGHSFERRCTSCHVTGSTGYHRIILYSFAGLRFIVRYEADGYIGVPGVQLGLGSAGQQAPDVDDLSNVLYSLSLSPGIRNSERNYFDDSKLVIRNEGRESPLSSIIEIETRTEHRPLAFEDVVTQLWVSQMSKLVRAYHSQGVFATPKVEDVAAQINAWEDENEKDLGKLASLIGKIRDIVK